MPFCVFLLLELLVSLGRCAIHALYWFNLQMVINSCTQCCCTLLQNLWYCFANLDRLSETPPERSPSYSRLPHPHTPSVQTSYWESCQRPQNEWETWLTAVASQLGAGGPYPPHSAMSATPSLLSSVKEENDQDTICQAKNQHWYVSNHL